MYFKMGFEIFVIVFGALLLGALVFDQLVKRSAQPADAHPFSIPSNVREPRPLTLSEMQAIQGAKTLGNYHFDSLS